MCIVSGSFSWNPDHLLRVQGGLALLKDEFSLSFWFLFHYREVTGVQREERPEVELGILKSQALGALRTLHAFFPGTQDFSSSPNPASSISRPEAVARVQPPGIWLRLRWRRGEAGRRWAELHGAQPGGSGRAAALRSPSPAWRAAGGRRAPTLRSPAASSLRLSAASAGKPTAGLHLPRRARVPLRAELT